MLLRPVLRFRCAPEAVVPDVNRPILMSRAVEPPRCRICLLDLVPNTEDAGREVCQEILAAPDRVDDLHGTPRVDPVIARHQLRHAGAQDELAPCMLIEVGEQRVEFFRPPLRHRFLAVTLRAQELQIFRVIPVEGVRTDGVDVITLQGILAAALRAATSLASQEQVVVLPARLPFRLEEVEERRH